MNNHLVMINLSVKNINKIMKQIIQIIKINKNAKVMLLYFQGKILYQIIIILITIRIKECIIIRIISVYLVIFKRPI